jgi:glycosyltransferase involved in cell wall biosynthesis
VKILFLINNAFGIGGTIQTTFNLGGALAARGHDVEVLSTVRGRETPQLWADPRIRLMALTETRESHPDYEKDAPGRDRPAALYPGTDYRAGTYNEYVEERYRRYLRASDADVVIATRPGLIVYAAQLAPSHMIRIGQEHLTRDRHKKALRRLMPQHLRRLDAFVTVSARDADDYRRHLRLGHTRLLFIPNSVPAPRVPPTNGRAKLVIAAGRLVGSKRYDVLLRAFARVAAERPDWQLRLYGDGEQRDNLRALVDELGLHNNVRMMGSYSPIETEWAKASIAAVSADQEPFGMTLVEAMRAGLPVVSTDAPHGPREIITEGVDGLLTPVGDPEALGAALLRVINDDDKRREMSAAALANSRRYDPEPIAEQYEKLFEELKTGRWRWRLPRKPMTVLGPAPSATVSAADCVVTPDGRLEVRTAEEGLFWRRGGADDVPAGATVPYGWWKLHRPDGTPVQAGYRDARALLELPDGVTHIETPYQHRDGALGVRVVEAPVRAEVDQIRADKEGVHLVVRLAGVEPSEPVLVVRGDEEEREIPIAAPGTVTVPPLPPGEWTLWVRPAPGTDVVRLTATADDIYDKRIAWVLPSTPEQRPFFSAANELGITASL